MLYNLVSNTYLYLLEKRKLKGEMAVQLEEYISCYVV